MSYKTYTTEALVCGSKANNTSDKVYLLFTREAGMLWATARSVREERSKQRFALQDFSLVRVSLVRGKNGWRIGSVESEGNYFVESRTQSRRATVTSIVRLLRQFLHGEDYQPMLFDDTKMALKQAIKGSEESILYIYSLRMLHKLGYVAENKAISTYLQSEKWWDLPPLSKDIMATIDRAKQVSHL